MQFCDSKTAKFAVLPSSSFIQSIGSVDSSDVVTIFGTLSADPFVGENLSPKANRLRKTVLHLERTNAHVTLIFAIDAKNRTVKVHDAEVHFERAPSEQAVKRLLGWLAIRGGSKFLSHEILG